MTCQLNNEKRSLKLAKEYLTSNINMIKELQFPIIKEYGSGSLNKQEEHSGDFLLKNGIMISVKNKKGNFTKANLGTGKFSKHWQYLPSKYLEKCILAINISNHRKKELINKYGKKWKDIPSNNRQQEERNYVIDPIINFYLSMFNENQENIIKILKYLNHRESDYLLITNDKIENTIVIGKTLINTNNYFIVKKIKSKSIGIYLNTVLITELRFKSEGGDIKSTIKINVQ